MSFIKVCKQSDLPPESHQIVKVGSREVALFHYEKKITALGNSCLHKGGPLGKGFIRATKDGLCVTCPWHGWQYRLSDGKPPGGGDEQQAVYKVKVKDGSIYVSDKPIITAKAPVHAPGPLADLAKLQYQTTPKSLNILGISSTNLNADLPRTSTSELALEEALKYAADKHGAATRLIRLRELGFRACEGYYSQDARACTWPCSITEMDGKDRMTEVYRSMVLWCDVLLVATPIRWGNPSSLYFKMCERLNCVQNQITLHDRVLIKNKVASFIITGGQDNIQQVAGQMSNFFTNLGFMFPPFNFVGWSRGWTAEDMEQNVELFRKSSYLKRSVRELVDNAVLLTRQVKQMDCTKLKSPLPRRSEAATQGSD